MKSASMILPLLAAAGCSAAELPNFLFLLADDMGWGDVSYNKDYYQPGAGGKDWIVNPPRTPNLDEIAKADGTMLFKRMYAGSAVCSPTRASVFSGRTPRRECIDGAEGCGQRPAWNCYDKLPFPKTTFTVAEAAKEKGYSTFFAGKWHLGDFWVKGEPPTYAMKKWPSSHPGQHGFDTWHATEASAESSTLNCGCVPEWKFEGKGCVNGSGKWERSSLECTNYWFFSEDTPSPHCMEPATTDRGCVANLTQKITGDDSLHIVSQFEDFLGNKSQDQPFLAALFLHTNHVPHYALPEWYHAYNDTFGNPAGNYLGTLSQMDFAIGELWKLLKAKNLDENTLIWFTADNGAHSLSDESRPGGQNSASNGLRQCKASLFEGGIREPGFIRWPSKIKGHQETNYTTCTVDFLPTVLDILDVKYPNPSWAIDGISLLNLLQGEIPLEGAPRQILGFAQSGQFAMINDTGSAVWKIVESPAKGQCPIMLPPWKVGGVGPYLFRLDQDPTESSDVCSSEPSVCLQMKAALADFKTSIKTSRTDESGCAPPGSSLEVLQHAVPEIKTSGAKIIEKKSKDCLSVSKIGDYHVLSLGSCTADIATSWRISVSGELSNNAFPSFTTSTEMVSGTKDNILMLEKSPANPVGIVFANGRLQSNGQCIASTVGSKIYTILSNTLALNSCDEFGLEFAVEN